MKTTKLFAGIAIAIPSFYFIQSYCHGRPCPVVKPDLTGKIVVITGASDGIGKATARDIAQQRATVVFACRNEEKTKKVIEMIKKASKNDNIDFIKCDLNDLESVRQFAAQYRQKYGQKIDVLIQNAGIMPLYGKQNDGKSTQGYEQIFSTNYLGHFLLSQLFEESLAATPQSRVVVLSSRVHESVLNEEQLDLKSIENQIPDGLLQTLKAYARSKVCQMLHTKMLQERLKESGSKVVAVSPGLVRTNIFSSDKNSSDTTMARIAYYLHTIFYPFIWTFSKNEIEGAQTTLYCVYEDFAKLEGGAYYHDCSLREASTLANDRGLAKQLWDKSLMLVSKK